MTVTSGKLSASCPARPVDALRPNQSFTVAANTKFKVKADEETSYSASIVRAFKHNLAGWFWWHGQKRSVAMETANIV